MTASHLSHLSLVPIDSLPSAPRGAARGLYSETRTQDSLLAHPSSLPLRDANMAYQPAILEPQLLPAEAHPFANLEPQWALHCPLGTVKPCLGASAQAGPSTGVSR